MGAFFLFSVFAMSDLLKTTKIEVALGHPVAICAFNDGLAVLDRDEASVNYLTWGGTLSRFAGRKGQGPGEFEVPTSIGIHNGRILVYDQNKSSIAAFSPSGEYVTDVAVPQGYAVIFLKETLILSRSMNKSLLTQCDYKGHILQEIGEGRLTDPLSAFGYMSHASVDPSGGSIYCFYLTGEKCEIYSLKTGRLQKTLTLGLNRFAKESKKKSEVDGGSAQFSVDGGYPVLGSFVTNSRLVVLVEDENLEETSYLVLMDLNGGELKRFSMDIFARRMAIINDRVVFLTSSGEEIIAYCSLDVFK